MTVPLTNRLAFGQKQGNELIEVLQEIRDELRYMNSNGIGISCSLDSETSNSLDRIAQVLEKND